MLNEKASSNQVTPEEAYECRETSRLLHEMIDDLPEAQRQCILLFYMEEYSIKDIAAACDCNENTVKSRLNYGKKRLEEKTIEMQNKGYVLRGVTPVYLITWLFKTDMSNKMKFVYGKACTGEFVHSLFAKFIDAGFVTAVNSGLTSAVNSGMTNAVDSGMTSMVSSGMNSMVDSGMTTISGEAVTNGTATVTGGITTTSGGSVTGGGATVTGGTVAKGVATGAAKTGIHTIAGKIVAGIVAVAITGGLATTGIIINKNRNNTDNEPTTEITEAASEEASTTEVITTEAVTTEVASEEELVSDTLVTGDVENNPTVNYEEMYSEVIDEYISLTSEDTSNSEDEETLQEKYKYIDTSLPMIAFDDDDIGYWINDIDGNGIPELMIGSCSDSEILGLYTIKDNEVVTLIVCYGRMLLYYCGDNMFSFYGIGGARTGCFILYELNSGNLDFVETTSQDWGLYYFSTDPDFNTTTGDCDYSKGTEISESEYEELKNKYTNNGYAISGMIPLSEY